MEDNKTVNEETMPVQSASNKKLKTCKVCGTLVAKSASTCPNCGAKLKKSKKPAIIVLLLTIIALPVILYLLLFLAGNIGFGQVRKNTTFTIEKTQVSYSSEEFRTTYLDYKNNGKVEAFQSEFLPLSVTYKGNIISISEVYKCHKDDYVGFDSEALPHSYKYDPFSNTEMIVFRIIKTGDGFEFAICADEKDRDVIENFAFSANDTVTITGSIESGTLEDCATCSNIKAITTIENIKKAE